MKKILNILDPVLNILSSQKFPEQAIGYVTYMENDLLLMSNTQRRRLMSTRSVHITSSLQIVRRSTNLTVVVKAISSLYTEYGSTDQTSTVANRGRLNKERQ